MKKSIILLCALQCLLLISCNRNDKNISISYRDNEEAYSMNARFSERNTRAAELYMNEKIGRKNNISFLNTRTDATITLGDGLKFYMQKSPGHIKIKLNKAENSGSAYHSIKLMCQGMKDVLLK